MRQLYGRVIQPLAEENEGLHGVTYGELLIDELFSVLVANLAGLVHETRAAASPAQVLGH